MTDGDGALRGMEMRRTAYRGVAGAFAVFLFLYSPLSLLVIGWFADFEDAISHRVHEVSFGALFAVIFVGALAQLGRAERQVAGLLQMLFATASLAIVVSASTGPEVTVLAYVVPPIALLAVHPDLGSVLRSGVRPVRGLMGALAVAGIPMAVLTWDNFQKALDRVQGHESHWGAMAAFAVAIVFVTGVAALGLPGWRVSAGSAAAAVATHATVSLAFRFDASALAIAQAVVALLWSATVIAVAVRGEAGESPLVRRRDERLVAGVAAALARSRGVSPAWVRLGFVLIPVAGPVAYLALWAILPADGPRRIRLRMRRPSSKLIVGAAAVGVVLVFLGPAGVGLALPLAIVAVLVTSAWRVEGGLFQRLRAFAASSGVALALLFAIGLWSSDRVFETPVVPHQIESRATSYCVTCHVAGEARGAPIIELGAHPYENPVVESCSSCHDHLPPDAIPETHAAMWELGLLRPGSGFGAP